MHIFVVFFFQITPPPPLYQLHYSSCVFVQVYPEDVCYLLERLNTFFFFIKMDNRDNRPEATVRSCLVVIASFVCNGLVFSFINSYSVTYVYLLKKLEDAGVSEASSKACKYLRNSRLNFTFRLEIVKFLSTITLTVYSVPGKIDLISRIALTVSWLIPSPLPQFHFTMVLLQVHTFGSRSRP